MESLYGALALVEPALGRKINPTLYTPHEFADRKSSGNVLIVSAIAAKRGWTSPWKGYAKGCTTADELWRYAHKARVWTVMRPYVDAMQSDAA